MTTLNNSVKPLLSYLKSVKKGETPLSYEQLKDLKLSKNAIAATRQIVLIAKADKAVGILYELASYSMTIKDFTKKVEQTASQSQMSFEFE